MTGETSIQDIFYLVRCMKCKEALSALEDQPEVWTARDEAGHSLLHWGSLVGDEDFVKSALGEGCKVDAQSQNQQTPLMWALIRGCTAVVRLLLEADANLRVHDSLGATPLMIAVQHTGNVRYQLMLMLLHRGGQDLLSDVDCKGCTAVHWAAWKGDLTALKLLDNYSADMGVLDHEKMTPLHRCVLARQAKVVPFLLEKRLDPQQRDASGRSSFDLRAQGDFPLLAALMGGKGGPSPPSIGRQDQADAEDSGMRESGDFVEVLLRDSGATWLTPYYQQAVGAILDALGGVGERCERSSPDSEPLVGEGSGGAVQAAQTTWEWGNDGL